MGVGVCVHPCVGGEGGCGWGGWVWVGTVGVGRWVAECMWYIKHYNSVTLSSQYFTSSMPTCSTPNRVYK